MFAVQGFGRFGPFGPARSNSEVRYELGQDWGLVFWWPLVLFGVFQTIPVGTATAPRGHAAVGLRAPDLGGRELGGRGRLPSAGVGPLPAADPGTQCAAGRGGGVQALGAMAREGGGRVRRTFTPAARGLPHPAGERRVLLAFPRLEHRQPADAHLRDGGSRHGRRSPGSTSRPGTRPGSAASIIPTSSRVIPCWRRCLTPARKRASGLPPHPLDVSRR